MSGMRYRESGRDCLCCAAGQSEHIRWTLTAVREYYASLGFEDVDTRPPYAFEREES